MRENIFNLFVLGWEMKRREAMLHDTESVRGEKVKTPFKQKGWQNDTAK